MSDYAEYFPDHKVNVNPSGFTAEEESYLDAILREYLTEDEVEDYYTTPRINDKDAKIHEVFLKTEEFFRKPNRIDIVVEEAEKVNYDFDIFRLWCINDVDDRKVLIYEGVCEDVKSIRDAFRNNEKEFDFNYNKFAAMNEAKDFIDKNSTSLTFDEADEILNKNEKTPDIKLIGADIEINPLPEQMMMKFNISSGVDVVKSEEHIYMLRNQKKEDLPLFSFTIDGKVTALILDIENGTSLRTFLKAIDGFAYLAYWSSSSELENQRFRVVMPLAEPIDGCELNFCKNRLMKIFDEIPDPHSFEHSRFFFMPSRYLGMSKDENKIFEKPGKPIDFYKTTGFSELDKLYANKSKANAKLNKEDVIDDDRVQYYLNTDFPLMKGNGDSASSLYTAIVTCLAHDDEDTLDIVLDKARSERWSEKELDRNIKSAKKFLGIE